MRVNDALKKVNDIGGTFASGFLTDISHGVDAMTALHNALTRLSDTLIDMAARKLFASALGGFDISSLFGLGGIGKAGVAHTGGVLGTDSLPSRYIHPAYFDHAPKFGGGGIVGGEVPIIAHKGEGVFTPAQMAAMGGGGPGMLKQEITFKIDGAVGKSEIVAMIGQGMAIAKSQAISASMAAMPARQDQARKLGT